MAAIPTLPPNDYDETDSSAGALWPTPRAYSYDQSHTPGLTTLDIRVRGLYKHKKRYWPKRAGREPMDTGQSASLWPTPSACNANDGEGAETWLARRERLKEKGYNGNGAGIPLAIAVQVPGECVQGASTSSTEVHRVSPLAQRVSALVRAIRAGAGPSSCALLASWNPDGYWQSLQLALCLCDTETGSRPLDEYSSSWPRWGTVAAGVSGQPQMWALRTDATESSLSQGEQTQWSTPRVAMASMYAEDDETFDGRGKQTRETLARQAAQSALAWPTPTTQDGENSAGASQQQRHTPPLNAAVGGSLNPRWVCLMMALPPDYLTIPPLPGQGGPRVRAMHSTPTNHPDLPEECPSE